MSKEQFASAASHMYGPDIPHHYHVKRLRIVTQAWLDGYLGRLSEEDRSVALDVIAKVAPPQRSELSRLGWALSQQRQFQAPAQYQVSPSLFGGMFGGFL